MVQGIDTSAPQKLTSGSIFVIVMVVSCRKVNSYEKRCTSEDTFDFRNLELVIFDGSGKISRFEKNATNNQSLLPLF
jgi:hypothetical protein